MPQKTRGTRGAYRREDRVQLPKELQRKLVGKAAQRAGSCQELARVLNIPKSSVHYYLVGRLTMPKSVLEDMLEVASDEDLTACVMSQGVERDRTWANQHAQSVYRDQLISRLRLPTREDLENDDDLRRKAAAIVSYVMAEGSIWMQTKKWGEHAANITFAAHETDLYEHFRSLLRDVSDYEMGPPEKPGNQTNAIRGFIYSRFVAEWLFENGVPVGEKSSAPYHLPEWVLHSRDRGTLVSALQPWCDGEGSVKTTREGSLAFVLSQSRHTDLDFETVPLRMASYGSPPTIGIHAIRALEVFTVPLEDYCKALFKSEILWDLQSIATRIGLRPRIRLETMNLKQNGFWSCCWAMRFEGRDTLMLVRIGGILQQMKRTAVLSV
ncbi:MAG: hypothetical protein QXU73_02105 [Thermoplasmata archaeon]